MPELPEVETVAKSLRPYIVGKKIQAVQILKPKSLPQSQLLDKVIGQRITAVCRLAKMIDITLSNNYQLLVHLKMTGQLLYRDKQQLAGGGHPTKDFKQQLPGKHTRVIIELSDDSRLFFNDMRIFGWVKILTSQQLRQELTAYGPDAHRVTDINMLCQQLARRSLPIKQVLMDNHVLAGIGNIYACEILFASHIDPRRPAKSLKHQEVETIVTQARVILEEAIANRGTTFDGRYVDADGVGGNYEEKLQVYGRSGRPCRSCQTVLQNVKIGGRSTVYCPVCQQ